MEIFAPLFAFLAYVATPGGPQAFAAEQHQKPAVTSKAKSKGYSPYSSNPEYDVYLNGRYIGSDPDPRVRYHMLQEERGRHDGSGRERPN